jgi:uncharacterized protein YllA (UPF0747 family)
LTALVGDKGLILVDPLDPELKKIVAPLYAEAARHAQKIAGAIVAAVANSKRRLSCAGYAFRRLLSFVPA